MSVFDFYTDYEINKRIIKRMKSIASKGKRVDFRLEVLRELFDFMPFDRQEANLIIDRVYRKFTLQ